jgi:hypothetical protein
MDVHRRRLSYPIHIPSCTLLQTHPPHPAAYSHLSDAAEIPRVPPARVRFPVRFPILGPSLPSLSVLPTPSRQSEESAESAMQQGQRPLAPITDAPQLRVFFHVLHHHLRARRHIIGVHVVGQHTRQKNMSSSQRSCSARMRYERRWWALHPCSRRPAMWGEARERRCGGGDGGGGDGGGVGGLITTPRSGKGSESRDIIILFFLEW